jgi:hypothetical protein
VKIVFLGAIGEGQTSRMRMRALSRLGHEVIGYDTERPWAEASWAARQAQRRLSRGPVIDAINRRVRELADEAKPQLIWAEKQEYLRPRRRAQPTFHPRSLFLALVAAHRADGGGDRAVRRAGLLQDLRARRLRGAGQAAYLHAARLL